MSLRSLDLFEPILTALHEKGYFKPTPIQQKEIPQIILKHDIIGAHRIAKDLNGSGITSESIHGDKSQVSRIGALHNTAKTCTPRIGRTGRAGISGSTFSFCDVTERTYLKNINEISIQKLASLYHPFN